jgi:two-component system, NarL family, invasion response regulator UvrY
LPAKKIKVLLVDDHDLVRTGIKHMLKEVQDIDVIAEASNGEDAIKLTRNLEPHVILMDVKMPGIGGLGATRRLIRTNPDIKILVVTVCDDDLFPSRLLQAGAFGYLTKGASLNEMVKAIHTVFNGQRYISPSIASQLAIKHLTNASESPFEQLSERELQVALMIVNCVQVSEIATSLCLSNKTVNSYRYRIFEKLNARNDVELTHLAIRYQLIDTLKQDEAEETSE